MNDPEISPREFLISELKRLREKVGRIPAKTDLKRCIGFPPLSQFQKEFGSWTDTLVFVYPEEVKPDKYGRFQRITKVNNEENPTNKAEELSDTGFDMTIVESCIVDKNESLPEEVDKDCIIMDDPEEVIEPEKIVKEYTENTNTITYITPNYDALIKYGITHNLGEPYTLKEETCMCEEETERDYLLAQLIRFEKENNRIPVKEDLKENLGYPDKKRYKTEFGSLDKALKIAFRAKKQILLYGDKCTYLIVEEDRYRKIDDDLL